MRFATYNVYLNRPYKDQLKNDLLAGDDQARAVAEIIQRVRPDIILLNEFDFDATQTSLNTFVDAYLGQSQNGTEPIHYSYRYLAPSNTGIAAPIDVNGDDKVEGPTDAYGYGHFPGQYGMALLSKFPIQKDGVRTMQNFLWKDMPGALLPDNLSTGEPQDFYAPAELAIFRLSSKSHWDIPIEIHGAPIHVLAAHPTPAVFDGPEDHNGRRNHDEIRLWADYLDDADYIYDDHGQRGGLETNTRFVIMGDYNADPIDGDSFNQAISQLLNHPLVDNSFVPKSEGGTTAAKLDNPVPPHQGDPAADTSDFSQNLRIDYVLPSKWGLNTIDSGVFWPSQDDPLYRLIGPGKPIISSDHRLVWADMLINDCAKTR